MPKQRSNRLLSLALTWLLLAGCASTSVTNPVTGRAEHNWAKPLVVIAMKLAR